jgi:hypothetical protein
MSYDVTKYNELMQTCSALSTTHLLLQTGLFQGSNSKDVLKCINFIEALHKQAFTELEPLIAAKEEQETQEIEASKAEVINV